MLSYNNWTGIAYVMRRINNIVQSVHCIFIRATYAIELITYKMIQSRGDGLKALKFIRIVLWNLKPNVLFQLNTPWIKDLISHLLYHFRLQSLPEQENSDLST